MTSLSLKQIVEKALAEIGVSPKLAQLPKERPRKTTWIPAENDFGIRHYASGRHVYIDQTRMGGGAFGRSRSAQRQSSRGIRR